LKRFLILDDHPLFCEALQSAVRRVYVDAEVFEASSIEEGLEVLAKQKHLDLALLDLMLPGTNDFSGLLRIRNAYPKLPIVVVSQHNDPTIIREAVSLGIAGYIPKSALRGEVEVALREVLNGSVYLPRQFSASVEEDDSASNEQIVLNRLFELTPQQLLVLEMMRKGLQNKQIAYELKVAETTVKAHVSEILRKLHVYSRTKAVIEVAKLDFSAVLKRKR
jgi:DNA-binding NarL/FixJ family response regulator